ncbi:ankyrin repeat domain-containing protein [Tahibacter amnicola]|uniref:Ankyrin repeat domain-containing protein n=1 Tax=Tahibacter amnicola TaxID=2976241 RepID=A0ABY6B9T7_9GAMM|nr:ankyrin repeat domain-containing protein [Tahibacter amnicola]UXI66833.1 ankyrin repeat domain-containing protein [Tahibacter amnicola]
MSLERAIQENDAAMIRALLAGGCDPDARLPNGELPLQLAAGNSQNEAVLALLDGVQIQDESDRMARTTTFTPTPIRS